MHLHKDENKLQEEYIPATIQPEESNNITNTFENTSVAQNLERDIVQINKNTAPRRSGQML